LLFCATRPILRGDYLMRLALIVLTAIAITLGLLCWMMHP
jgi:hypothetical protein